MAKKIILAVVVLVVALAAFFGGKLYASLSNTSERAADAFIADVTKAEADASYNKLTTNYQKQYAKADWQAFVHQFKDFDGVTELVKHEDVTSSFNTYVEDSKPQRFIYEMKLDGRTYQIKVVLLKVNKLWKVDDLQGYFKQ
ncbi:MAG TPA: hypothetical protein VLA92_05030 [Candidatus Saccharimonadales bacterium]|nr:hypothetical protein [Candidatus Saccharimonadales bacterium]